MATGLSDPKPGRREAEDLRHRQENLAQTSFAELVPELVRISEDYRTASAEAFAGVEPDIAGMVRILPLTPQMLLELDGAGNAFFGAKDTPVTPEDVAQLLWRCSPLFVRNTPEAEALRSYFVGLLYVLDYNRAIEDIEAYVRRSWQGMPQWKSKPGAEHGLGQWPARLVHMFASNYHWSEDYILNLPFRRLWQYANRILEDNDPDYKEQCAAALRLRSQWLAEVNEAAQKLTKGGSN